MRKQMKHSVTVTTNFSVQDFSSKSLRHWDILTDLSKKVNDFLASLSLLAMPPFRLDVLAPEERCFSIKRVITLFPTKIIGEGLIKRGNLHQAKPSTKEQQSVILHKLFIAHLHKILVRVRIIIRVSLKNVFIQTFTTRGYCSLLNCRGFLKPAIVKNGMIIMYTPDWIQWRSTLFKLNWISEQLSMNCTLTRMHKCLEVNFLLSPCYQNCQ